MNRNTGIFLAFVAGAALGAAVAYVATTEKGEEAMDELRDFIVRTRRTVNDQLSKAGLGNLGGNREVPEEEMADDVA